MSSAEDDLNYKIYFQAKLDAGSTLASLKALEGQLDALLASAAITPEAFNAIDHALTDTRAGLEDLTVVVQRLASSSAVKGFLADIKAVEAETRQAARDTAKEVADSERVKRDEIKATTKTEEEAAKVYTLSATRPQLRTRLLAAGPFDTSAISPELQSAADAITLSGLKATRQFTAAENAARGEAKALYDGKIQIDGHVKAYEARNKQIEASTKLESEYNKYLADEAKALYANNRQIDAQVIAYERVQKAIEAKTQSESLYNKYLREQTANTAAQVKAQFAVNPAANRVGLGNFYPLIVAAGIFGTLARKTEDVGLAAGKMAADYEHAFASVARTANTDGGVSGAQIDSIRKSLVQLDTQLPLSFEDLSKIATAGNEIGVSAAGITGFTKTVAEYSTVTGTAADVTATAFGSLGQILKIPSTEYANFGSAVSLVGRKSVATEAEVLSMTAKIGASAHQANFTTAQILGLSGALASLREAPERSQGALEIYFKNVNSAAAEGGKKLQAYADAVHMSADAAQEMIKNNPYGFLLQLLQAIGNQKGIVAQTTMLQGLGLSATRVSEVLRRLSTNTDLLGNLTKLANQGYSEGTDLSTQYAKATDTLAAKFKELQNAFDNFLATIGGSGLAQALSGIVGGLKQVVIWITSLAQGNPILTNLVISFAAFLGLMLAVRAASLGATIATIALESAQVRLQGVSKLDGLKTLLSLLTNIPIQTGAAKKATEALTLAQKESIDVMMQKGVVEDEAAAMKALGITELGVATDTEVATGAMVGFRSVLLSMGVGVAVLALTALTAAFLSTSDSASSFDSAGLTDALKADEATYEKTGKAIALMTQATDVSTTATDEWVKANDKASGGQKTLDASLQHTTKSIQNQTVAFGANAKAALQNAVANDAAFNKIFSDPKVRSGLAKVGFDPAEFAKRLVNDPTGAAGEKYLQGYEDKITKSLSKRARGNYGVAGSDTQQAAITELRDLQGTVDMARDKIAKAAAEEAAFAAVHSKSGHAVAQLTVYEQAYAAALAESSQAQAQNNSLVDESTAVQDAYLTSLFAGVNAYYAQASALSSMGQEYVQNGAAAAFSGASFQAYIKSVVESDPRHAAERLKELENSIVGAGYAASASAPSMAYLNQVIDNMGGSDTKKLATDVFPSFTDAVKAANDAMSQAGTSAGTAADGINKLGKQVITVTDYAGNLSSTFKEAFDIRFGKQQGLDDISLQFQSMQDNAKSAKKAIEDAKQSIQQYEASISKTRADNANQKYFLSVANQFGDSARAGEIQGQIDQNNASIAGDTSSMKQAQLDLAAAEDKLSTSYTSNTAGAIGNREALYTLAQKYEDYIGKLAASGASQKTLNAAVAKAKEDFEKQATALGYSKSAIDKVSGAFSDMTTIIKKIPPANVKITGLSAGEAAVKDFMAKLNATVTNGVKGINHTLHGIGTGPIPGPVVKPRMSSEQAARESIKAQMLPYIAYLEFAGNSPSLADNATVARYERALQSLQTELQYVAGNYAEGGYTGPGGKYQAAGVVHKGEYVVPAYMVNQNTGLPYADALGRLISGVSAQASSYAHGGYVGGDMMVTELGPRSLGVLRQLVNNEVVAVISAQNVANAVNATNANNRRRGR